MVRVLPTRAARADLADIRRFSLGRFGPEAADAYFLGFDKAFLLLAEHSNAGEARPEWGDDLRCLTHRRHRIIYRVKPGVIEIVRVLHHARDVSRALDG